METFISGNYEVSVLDKNKKEDLIEVQKLRYDHLLRDFNPSLEEGLIDDDGYDQYCDSLIVKDLTTNKIVGTYRVCTLETAKGHPFKSEEEFNIDELKNSGYGIVETGRAVVHKDYRNGSVIGLLWKALFMYTVSNNCRFIFGTCSFHGTNPKVFDKLFAYLKDNNLNKDYNMYATKDSFEFEDIPYVKEEIEIPSLLKGYMRLGTTISRNGFIDYDFNCCDIITMIDTETINPRYLKHYLG